MKFIDYVQLNPFQKFWYNLKKFFINLPSNLGKIFKAIGRFFKKMFVGIGKGFAGYFSRFVKGDWATKISYLIMGFGNIVKGQIIKGLIFLATEVLFILYMIGFGWDKIYNLGFFNHGTIGFREEGYGINPVTGRPGRIEGDDSMKLLLYGVMTLIIIGIFFAIYIANTKSAYKAQQLKAAGEPLPKFKDEFKEFFDDKFHVTLLAFPTLTITPTSVRCSSGSASRRSATYSRTPAPLPWARPS